MKPTLPASGPSDEGQELPAEKHFTVREVAERLRISLQAVYLLCSERKLRHLRLGVGRGTVRIPASALADFIAQATVQAEEPTKSEGTGDGDDCSAKG
jgi:excisionase family DNA binding protein